MKKKSQKESPVTFRARWPRYTKPKLWSKLLIYLYSGISGEKEANAELFKHIKQLNKLDFDTAGPAYLKNGTKVSIKPEMPGFRFSPDESIVTWYGNFIPVEFCMKPLLKGPFPQRGKKIYGHVSFFVGPLQIAEINLNVIVKKRLLGDEEFTTNIEASAPYRKIFVSCAREDLHITEIIGKTYEAIGDKYMRDVKYLPHREKWWPVICKLIKEADEFHLFWSKAAKKSKYVEMEWREALKRKKKNFIRPIYWEKPMPKPPPELIDIHFKYIGEMIQRLMS